jgi:hypothetical protein
MCGCSVSQISNRIQGTRDIIERSGFIQNNLGASHVTRANIINSHTTTFAEKFFGEDKSKLVLVADGEHLVCGNVSFHFIFGFLCYHLCSFRGYFC